MMQKLLGEKQLGKLFIVSAPAGTGKTTLVQMLTQEFPCIVESVSYTTRLPRPGEIDGVHYNFIDQQQFAEKIASDEFLEHVTLYGYSYGTSRHWVSAQLGAGKHVVLVIDTQGALQLMNIVEAVYIFIAPPSVDELRRRLEKRGTEPPQKIKERLAVAIDELEASKWYDYYVMNSDLNIAYQVLRSIFIAEEHRLKS